MTALTLSPRARRRLVDRGLDVLTWLVLLVMLSPFLWLLISSVQDDLELSTGAYDLLHPTLRAFTDMWEHDRLRALLPQQPDHLHGVGAAGDRVREHGRLRARALQVPRLALDVG